MSIRLNLGCGPKLLEGYDNIDVDTREQIEKRYDIKLPANIHVWRFDVCNLDLYYEDSSVDEVLCEGFVEHLSFEEEGRFFRGVQRILKPGGKFIFTTMDFDAMVQAWQDAADNFVNFYQVGLKEDWFGQGDRNIKNKWGYLVASFFGNQNGQGQFHKNAFTEAKIYKIMKMLGFSCEISFFNFKDTEIKMMKCEAVKL
jgi:predicted SAM-dependent methyltransferase